MTYHDNERAYRIVARPAPGRPAPGHVEAEMLRTRCERFAEEVDRLRFIVAFQAAMIGVFVLYGVVRWLW
jgi:hypothetical protein